MRLFYEAWCTIENNSSVATDKFDSNSPIAIAELKVCTDNKYNIIRQLQLANYPDFPIAEFLSISFTHHIRIIEYVNYIIQDFRQPMGVATYKTADEVDPELVKLLPPKEELVKLLDTGEGAE